MAAVDVDSSLGALVTDRPEFAREFERLGLDYCCGGERSLSDACRESGLDAATVADTLAAAVSKTHEPARWTTI